MSARNVVEVFTNKSKDFMLEYGGSASWVISTSSAAAVDYCVCCRNDERSRDDDRGRRPEERNEAFLVGKVSGIEFVERVNDRDRYLIRFSEYAEVSIPGFRPGSMRNPVLYSDVEDCRRRGLIIEALEFKPMPEPTKRYERQSVERPAETRSPKGLTIAEAKQGLALHFNVPIDAVQITISG
jgi:hypothetical protein